MNYVLNFIFINYYIAKFPFTAAFLPRVKMIDFSFANELDLP